MSQQLQSRYPGIRSFEAPESALFFGRSRETSELYSLIKVEQAVVLFSKSGIGKSSLLNAGVLPLLEKDEFSSMKLRFQNTAIDPSEMLLQELRSKMAALSLSDMMDKRLQSWCINRKPTIWEYLKAAEMVMSYLPAKPLLVLDQFEEFFMHSSSAQEAFIDLLSDLIFGRVPQYVQKQLQASGISGGREEQWASPLNWKLVIAIRSDKFSFLDNLSHKIPPILNNRYQLHPLNRAQAKEAILMPAASAVLDFYSPTFEYSPDALNDILDNLSNEKGEIESFQLQIICCHLEELVVANNIQTIEKEHIGGSEGIDLILNNYYENAIKSIGKEEEQAKVRKLIEEGLIVDGTRVSLAESFILSRYDLSSELLQKVLNTRIIKPENTHLGKAYEVSHDTLVAPIVNSYEKRQQEELRLQMQAEKERLAAEAEVQKRKRKRVLILLILVSIVMLVIVVLLFWVLKLRDKANAELAKNESILSDMYFYADRFAMVVQKDDSTGHFRYGFMDRDGNTRIPYDYTEASPFDEYGYARVKIFEKLYLIDTNNVRYPLAESPLAITDSTMAVSLKEQHLEEMPTQIANNQQLKVLYLRGNNFKSLPDKMGQMKDLKTLDLGFNQFNSIPKVVFEIQSLEQLDLQSNRIERFSLPPNIKGKLKTIDLSFNALMELPSDIARLSHLEKLDLAGNELKNLANSLGDLKMLQMLNVVGNKLSTLPDKLKNSKLLKPSPNKKKKKKNNEG